MITAAGSGYGRFQDLSITRWREDVTRDSWGTFCYLRDVESGKYWSTAYQPLCREADRYEVTFRPDEVVFERHYSELVSRKAT